MFRCSKKPIQVGDVAPDFELPSQTGQPVRLSSFRGRTVVLYFYPKDDTYGCIAESCDFRDHHSDFTGSNAEIIGISSDAPASHARFAEKYKLPFLLLSDEDSAVRDLYGVPSTLGLIPGRVTFVIDPQGVVRSVFNSQFQPHSHVAQALRVLSDVHSSR
ncbi:MAG: peroxiredoxin [Elusimicrobia bacterium]|nr:peroxiredoxin [Elusimicrobiota bacterium]